MNTLTAFFQSGMGWVDLIAGIVVIGLVFYFVLRLRYLRERENELRDQISEAFTDQTIKK